MEKAKIIALKESVDEPDVLPGKREDHNASGAE